LHYIAIHAGVAVAWDDVMQAWESKASDVWLQQQKSQCIHNLLICI